MTEKQEKEAIIQLLEQRGNYDVQIHCIEKPDRGVRRCIVSYKWRLNAWEKTVVPHEQFFYIKNGQFYAV